MMTLITEKNKPYYLRKLTAFFLATSLILSNHLSYAAPTSPAQPTELNQFKTLNLEEILLPEESGTIQSTFLGDAGHSVILIQDAHSIPDAQASIHRLIEHFETAYGVGLIAVEGASTPLDLQIFKSFPDEELLKKVFGDYHRSGELTGPAAAALWSEGKSLYHGIEDWNLYEEQIAAYLNAVEREPQLLAALEEKHKQITEAKKSTFSEQLFKLDQKLERFYANQADLLLILRALSEVKAPSSDPELAVLLRESTSNSINDTVLRIEVRRMTQGMQGFLKSRPTTETTKAQIEALNAKFQEFQLSKITPQGLGLHLKDLIREYKLPVEFSERLDRFMKNENQMRDIKGTTLFKNFEVYADEVKASLFKTDEDRKLDGESKTLRLFTQFARLELTNEDWRRLKSSFVIARSAKRDEAISGRAHTEIASTRSGPLSRNDNWMDDLAPLLTNHVTFYEIAEERDDVFYEKLTDLMNRENAKTAVVVAGGFHTRGLTRRFEDKGISYALAMPKIASIPDEHAYRAHMQGDLSWADYFEVENGKVDLRKAFIRATRDKLLNEATQPRGYLLKTWRDQIIRDLANQGKIAEASKQTALIDEVADTTKQKSKRYQRLMEKVDEFVAGLRGLESRGALTEQNILDLVKPATTTPTTAAVAGSELIDGRLLGAKLRAGQPPRPTRLRFKARTQKQHAPRAEVRTVPSIAVRGKNYSLLDGSAIATPEGMPSADLLLNVLEKAGTPVRVVAPGSLIFGVMLPRGMEITNNYIREVKTGRHGDAVQTASNNEGVLASSGGHLKLSKATARLDTSEVELRAQLDFSPNVDSVVLFRQNSEADPYQILLEETFHELEGTDHMEKTLDEIFDDLLQILFWPSDTPPEGIKLAYTSMSSARIRAFRTRYLAAAADDDLGGPVDAFLKKLLFDILTHTKIKIEGEDEPIEVQDLFYEDYKRQTRHSWNFEDPTFRENLFASWIVKNDLTDLIKNQRFDEVPELTAHLQLPRRAEVRSVSDREAKIHHLMEIDISNDSIQRLVKRLKSPTPFPRLFHGTSLNGLDGTKRTRKQFLSADDAIKQNIPLVSGEAGRATGLQQGYVSVTEDFSNALFGYADGQQDLDPKNVANRLEKERQVFEMISNFDYRTVSDEVTARRFNQLNQLHQYLTSLTPEKLQRVRTLDVPVVLGLREDILARSQENPPDLELAREVKINNFVEVGETSDFFVKDDDLEKLKAILADLDQQNASIHLVGEGLLINTIRQKIITELYTFVDSANTYSSAASAFTDLTNRNLLDVVDALLETGDFDFNQFAQTIFTDRAEVRQDEGEEALEEVDVVGGAGTVAKRGWTETRTTGGRRVSKADLKTRLSQLAQARDLIYGATGDPNISQSIVRAKRQVLISEISELLAMVRAGGRDVGLTPEEKPSLERSLLGLRLPLDIAEADLELQEASAEFAKQLNPIKRTPKPELSASVRQARISTARKIADKVRTHVFKIVNDAAYIGGEHFDDRLVLLRDRYRRFVALDINKLDLRPLLTPDNIKEEASWTWLSISSIEELAEKEPIAFGSRLAAESPLPPRTGDVVQGRHYPYQLTRILPTTGRNPVFEARNVVNGDRVFVKITPADDASGDDSLHLIDVQKYYENGIRVLNHLRVNRFESAIEVLDWGIEERYSKSDLQYWICTEFVDGEPFDAWARNEDPQAVQEKFIEFLTVIEGLHALNVRHRDIKPGNVFVTDGPLKLLDLDQSVLDLRPDDLSVQLAQRVNIYTPGYTPPAIQSAIYSFVQKDIYALGMTLFSLARGEPAINLEPIVEEHQTDINRLTAVVRDNLTEPWKPFARVIARALSLGKVDESGTGNRYQTVTVMRDNMEMIYTKRTVSHAINRDDVRRRLEIINSKLRDLRSFSSKQNVTLKASTEKFLSNQILNPLIVQLNALNDYLEDDIRGSDIPLIENLSFINQTLNSFFSDQTYHEAIAALESNDALRVQLGVVRSYYLALQARFNLVRQHATLAPLRSKVDKLAEFFTFIATGPRQEDGFNGERTRSIVQSYEALNRKYETLKTEIHADLLKQGISILPEELKTIETRFEKAIQERLAELSGPRAEARQRGKETIWVQGEPIYLGGNGVPVYVEWTQSEMSVRMQSKFKSIVVTRGKSVSPIEVGTRTVRMENGDLVIEDKNLAGEPSRGGTWLDNGLQIPSGGKITFSEQLTLEASSVLTDGPLQIRYVGDQLIGRHGRSIGGFYELSFKGRTFILQEGVDYILGRPAEETQEADIPLLDQRASRRQAVIRLEDGVVSITDTSLNGTKVNGQLIESGVQHYVIQNSGMTHTAVKQVIQELAEKLKTEGLNDVLGRQDPDWGMQAWNGKDLNYKATRDQIFHRFFANFGISEISRDVETHLLEAALVLTVKKDKERDRRRAGGFGRRRSVGYERPGYPAKSAAPKQQPPAAELSVGAQMKYKFEHAMNLYERLGLRPGAPQEDIGPAYRKAQKDYHPDLKHQDWNKGRYDALSTRGLHVISKKLIEAFEVLNDPEARAEYDREHGFPEPRAEVRSVSDEKFFAQPVTLAPGESYTFRPANPFEIHREEAGEEVEVGGADDITIDLLIEDHRVITVDDQDRLWTALTRAALSSAPEHYQNRGIGGYKIEVLTDGRIQVTNILISDVPDQMLNLVADQVVIQPSVPDAENVQYDQGAGVIQIRGLQRSLDLKNFDGFWAYVRTVPGLHLDLNPDTRGEGWVRLKSQDSKSRHRESFAKTDDLETLAKNLIYHLKAFDFRSEVRTDVSPSIAMEIVENWFPVDRDASRAAQQYLGTLELFDAKIAELVSNADVLVQGSFARIDQKMPRLGYFERPGPSIDEFNAILFRYPQITLPEDAQLPSDLDLFVGPGIEDLGREDEIQEALYRARDVIFEETGVWADVKVGEARDYSEPPPADTTISIPELRKKLTEIADGTQGVRAEVHFEDSRELVADAALTKPVVTLVLYFNQPRGGPTFFPEDEFRAIAQLLETGATSVNAVYYNLDWAAGVFHDEGLLYPYVAPRVEQTRTEIFEFTNALFQKRIGPSGEFMVGLEAPSDRGEINRIILAKAIQTFAELFTEIVVQDETGNNRFVFTGNREARRVGPSVTRPLKNVGLNVTSAQSLRRVSVFGQQRFKPLMKLNAESVVDGAGDIWQIGVKLWAGEVSPEAQDLALLLQNAYAIIVALSKDEAEALSLYQQMLNHISLFNEFPGLRQNGIVQSGSQSSVVDAQSIDGLLRAWATEDQAAERASEAA